MRAGLSSRTSRPFRELCGLTFCCSLIPELGRGRKPSAGSRPMPTLIPQPTRIQAAGNKPKLIDEYIGRVNSKTAAASVAHMRSPQGWVEPGQTPEFDEFTIV